MPLGTDEKLIVDVKHPLYGPDTTHVCSTGKRFDGLPPGTAAARGSDCLSFAGQFQAHYAAVTK